MRRLACASGAVIAVLVTAGCGGSGAAWPASSHRYSAQQVETAFKAAGVPLHRVTGLGRLPGFVLLTVGRPSRDHFVSANVYSNVKALAETTTSGDRTESLRYGNVLLQWTRLLDPRVRAALSRLGRDHAPLLPKIATTTTPTPPYRPPTAAQALAKMPPVLRRAMRKTAAAPSAHVTITGEGFASSGDFSTVKRILVSHSRFQSDRSDQIIVGTTMYARSTALPAGSRRSTKWVKQALSERPLMVRARWPDVGLFTLLGLFATLRGSGRVTTQAPATIDGVETRHYQERIPLGLGGALGIPRTPMAETVDVWVGSNDGLIRRARLCLAGMNVFTAEISHFGEPVHVTIPPAADVISLPTTGKPIVSLISKGSTASGGRSGCS